MVNWKVFAMLVSLAVLVSGAGFSYFAVQIDRIGDAQSMNALRITLALEEIQQTQAVMRHQISTIKERQDYLRDLQQRSMTRP
jgi:hypothetical protein